jgi:hypothetical protein
MVWFFGRGKETVRVETRFDNASGEYVLELARPEQEVVTERFSDADAFRARLHVIELEMQAGSWQQIGSELLPPPWKGPFSS